MRRLIAPLALLLSWNLAIPVGANDDGAPKTATPVKHLVVIFDENESFDHYFGTYPNAQNGPGETPFYASSDTPRVDGLNPTLLSSNVNATNPTRLSPSDAATCDNVNKYTPEQQAFDSGLLDMFGITSAAAACGSIPGTSSEYFFAPNLAMYYYDGNTVTALWNYAQHFAMSDNFFDSEFGGTVLGHLNLLSGQTNGVIGLGGLSPSAAGVSASTVSNDTVINNINPIDDDCATPLTAAANISMTGNNIGNLLNRKKVSWGWFYDGFARTGFTGGVATCNSVYNAHYAPFEYYPSTANPHHAPPSSSTAIGTNVDQANHNYDLANLWQGLETGTLPAVTFVKFAKSDTGHPMDSSPLAEQTALVNTINRLMKSPYWKDMAILIAYDDSDGWYDHVAGPIVNHSAANANDAIQGTPSSAIPKSSSEKASGACGALGAGVDNDRCGFGVRLPFLVISPYAKHNYVDHSLNDTTSIMRFIEYNWDLGTLGSLGNANDKQSFDVLASGSVLGMFDFDSPAVPENRALILDPTTGEVVGPDVHGPWRF